MRDRLMLETARGRGYSTRDLSSQWSSSSGFICAQFTLGDHGLRDIGVTSVAGERFYAHQPSLASQPVEG